MRITVTQQGTYLGMHGPLNTSELVRSLEQARLQIEAKVIAESSFDIGDDEVETT